MFSSSFKTVIACLSHQWQYSNIFYNQLDTYIHMELYYFGIKYFFHIGHSFMKFQIICLLVVYSFDVIMNVWFNQNIWNWRLKWHVGENMKGHFEKDIKIVKQDINSLFFQILAHPLKQLHNFHGSSNLPGVNHLP